MEAATQAEVEDKPEREVSSFAKSLFLGEIHEELVFPYPAARRRASRSRIRGSERRRARVRATSIRPARDRGEALDRRRHDRASSASAGCCGLYVPEEYGGQGLSQTGYCRVFEAFAQIDATLSVVLGVHQSIGIKGIALFGTDEQKERFLPDLATGRKLAGVRADRARGRLGRLQHRVARGPAARRLVGAERREALHRQRLARADVFATFARCRGRRQGPPHRADPREGHEGLRGRRALRHDGPARQRPAPPLLQRRPRPAGERARRARRGLPDRDADPQQRPDRPRHRLGRRRQAAARPGDRPRQGARASSAAPLADFELVQDKIGWMVSYLFGLESMGYLTSGLVDAGVAGLLARVGDLQGRRDRVPLVRRPTARCSSRAAPGYMRDEPYEKILRDIRIFPIFEGANDVMRAFIALSGMKPLGEKLSGLGDIGLGDPIGSIGVLADYVGGRIQREVRPDRITMAHAELSDARRRGRRPGQASCARSPSRCCASTARGSSSASSSRSGSPTRSPTSTRRSRCSRASRSIFEEQGVEPSGQERYIAETFCTRAARRVRAQLRPDRAQRRRAHDGDRQARLQARRVRLRVVRGLIRARRSRSVQPPEEFRERAQGDRRAAGLRVERGATPDDVYNACVRQAGGQRPRGNRSQRRDRRLPAGRRRNDGSASVGRLIDRDLATNRALRHPADRFGRSRRPEGGRIVHIRRGCKCSPDFVRGSRSPTCARFSPC